MAALHDLGEAEMATSLSTTVAKECAKRHRKAALMVLPRAQERRRWCEVTHGLCKLIGDVVVWQVRMYIYVSVCVCMMCDACVHL